MYSEVTVLCLVKHTFQVVIIMFVFYKENYSYIVNLL